MEGRIFVRGLIPFFIVLGSLCNGKAVCTYLDLFGSNVIKLLSRHCIFCPGIVSSYHCLYCQPTQEQTHLAWSFVKAFCSDMACACIL